MSKKDDASKLNQLGSNTTTYKYDHSSVEILEVFPNLFNRNYTVELIFPEFTSLCPKTGQPDFASFTVEYIPDRMCLESKSVKLYFFSYRNCGSFMETITNNVLDDMVKACRPKWMRVTGHFNPRGGLVITPTAEYGVK